MKTPSIDASTALWVRVLLYLLARLTRNRRTRDLLVLVQPTFDALDAAEQATIRAERASITARAMYDGADDELDEAVTQFEGETLLFVGKNRKTALYQKLFPDGLVAITGAPIPDEIRHVKVLEQNIEQEMKGVEFAERLLPQIRAAREEMEHQSQLYQAAADAEAQAWSKELSARHDARRQYRIIYGELIKRFPESPKKVDTFFKDVGASRRKAVEPEEEDGTESSTPETAASTAGAKA